MEIHFKADPIVLIVIIPFAIIIFALMSLPADRLESLIKIVKLFFNWFKPLL